jgi:hypothetical protein
MSLLGDFAVGPETLIIVAILIICFGGVFNQCGWDC